MGVGCISNNYTTQYGNFSHGWLELNSATDPQDCEYDNETAVFTCKKKSAGNVYVKETYHCQKTANTKKIQNLVDEVFFKL